MAAGAQDGRVDSVSARFPPPRPRLTIATGHAPEFPVAFVAAIPPPARPFQNATRILPPCPTTSGAVTNAASPTTRPPPPTPFHNYPATNTPPDPGQSPSPQPPPSPHPPLPAPHPRPPSTCAFTTSLPSPTSTAAIPSPSAAAHNRRCPRLLTLTRSGGGRRTRIQQQPPGRWILGLEYTNNDDQRTACVVDLWLVCIPGCTKRTLRAAHAVGSPSLLLSVRLGGPRSGGHPLTGDTPSARIGGCGRSARLTERTASVQRRGPRGASPQLKCGLLCAAAHGPARVTVAPTHRATRPHGGGRRQRAAAPCRARRPSAPLLPQYPHPRAGCLPPRSSTAWWGGHATPPRVR